MTEPGRKTLVIKLGGSTLGGQTATGAPDTTLDDLLQLVAEGRQPVLVHGGGNAINGLLKKLGQEPHFHNGLRVTDRQALEAALMMMRGQINAELVAAINHTGQATAIGLSGVDARLFEARRDTAHGPLGLVGEITRVNRQAIRLLLDSGFLPVIAPFGAALDDPEARIFNINADNVAAYIAAALPAEACIFLTDVPGVLDKNRQTIARLNPVEAARLIEDGTISGGMIPKIEAALKALEGAQRVVIMDGRPAHALYRAATGQDVAGTVFER